MESATPSLCVVVCQNTCQDVARTSVRDQYMYLLLILCVRYVEPITFTSISVGKISFII